MRSSSWSTPAKPTLSTPNSTLPTSSRPVRARRTKIRIPFVVPFSSFPSLDLLTPSRLTQHHADNDIGVAVTDRYTHHVLTFLEGINKTSKVPIQNLVRSPPPPSLLPFPADPPPSTRTVRYVRPRRDPLYTGGQERPLPPPARGNVVDGFLRGRVRSRAGGG